jgi:predicted MFS family arabinose efflux permease
MNGVGFLVGSLTGPRLADRFGRKIVIGICLALLGSAVLLQATVVAWFPASLALALIQSAMESSRIASTNALMSGLLPGARGALQSLYTSLTQLGITVTAPIGGVVLATWGYPGVGWYVAALCSVALLVLVVWVREVRTLHQPAVVPPVPRP